MKYEKILEQYPSKHLNFGVKRSQHLNLVVTAALSSAMRGEAPCESDFGGYSLNSI
jgi:hypothetical protein